jgi:hypothetical protein
MSSAELNAAQHTARAMYDVLSSPNETDSNFETANVVDGLFAIARSMDRVADALRSLGTNNAATEMGALEAHSKNMREGIEALAEAIQQRST